MSAYRVLVVDDQREVRRALCAAIETLGQDFEVIDVPSGEEAMLVLSSGTFDLLVSDVRLPGITGIELLRKLKKLKPDMHVILVTGLMEAHYRQEVADAGADAFFLKPIDTADFLDAVERTLGLVDVHSGGGYDDLLLSKPVESVSERLTSLRKALDAISAVMLDERGRVLARAGDLPDASIETALFPALMSAFSASDRVSHLLGTTPPSDLMYFSGSKYDLILAHVGESYALLVATNPGASSDQIQANVKIMHIGIGDLITILAHMGVSLKSNDLPIVSDIEPEEETIEDVPELEALFQNADSADLEEDIDAFWDTASLKLPDDVITNADALTYDQARRLGLTPDDKE